MTPIVNGIRNDYRRELDFVYACLDEQSGRDVAAEYGVAPEAMLLTMSRGTLVLDPSISHGLFADDNACVHDIMVRFVDSPEEHVDVSCLSETPPVHWLLPHEWPERR